MRKRQELLDEDCSIVYFLYSQSDGGAASDAGMCKRSGVHNLVFLKYSHSHHLIRHFFKVTKGGRPMQVLVCARTLTCTSSMHKHTHTLPCYDQNVLEAGRNHTHTPTISPEFLQGGPRRLSGRKSHRPGTNSLRHKHTYTMFQGRISDDQSRSRISQGSVKDQ